MKVRWTKNSLRLRITPHELAMLRDGDSLHETLQIAAVVVWRVAVESGERTELRGVEGEIVLSLQSADLDTLMQTQREGVYFSSGDLRYYIEKDFPCAHPRASQSEEVESETFAPPHDFEERKNR